jgi:hypothetical protein
MMSMICVIWLGRIAVDSSICPAVHTQKQMGELWVEEEWWSWCMLCMTTWGNATLLSASRHPSTVNVTKFRITSVLILIIIIFAMPISVYQL